MAKEETYPRIHNMISNSHPSGLCYRGQSVELISIRWVVEVETLGDVFDSFSYSRPGEIAYARTLEGIEG